MITIVNLNPCLDWQYNVPSFTHGGMNRVRRISEAATSKGTNVAVVLKNLNHAPNCIGFNFLDGAEKVTARFDALDIGHDFINVPGAVRVNIKLFEEDSGTMTELNQPGSFVAQEYVEKLIQKVAAISNTGILVLSGSLPAGVPTDIYATLTKLWRGKVFVDAEGEPLLQAIAECPFAIKPNLYELESTFGVSLKTPAEIVNFCRTNLRSIKITAVSMGEEGAVLVTPDSAYFCPGIPVKAQGLAGAGDSMVAGLIHAIISGGGADEQLRMAAACATASVTLPGTELCTICDIDKFLPLVQVMAIPLT